MNNLIHFACGAGTNRCLAAETELPLTFRVSEDRGPILKAIKSDFILRAGSHHGMPLNALFAHRLYNDLSDGGSTIERIKELRASNLKVLAQNPSNIAAITSCMPDGCDPARIVHLAFPDCEDSDPAKSDFYFFVKGNDELCKQNPTDSIKLIAEIYILLQKYNRIEPTKQFKAKLDSIIPPPPDAKK